MTALGQRSAGVLLLLTAGLMVVSGARADELVDLRTSFARIEPYTRPPSPPVTREFSIPGPGSVRMRTTISPWFRSMDPVPFRSIEPVDGRDEGAWTGHVPGVERLTWTSTPKVWVDGGDLTIVIEYRVRKPRPRLVVGLFPSVVRHGDGSTLQLANSVQVTIEWTADASGGGAQPSEGLEGR